MINHKRVSGSWADYKISGLGFPCAPGTIRTVFTTYTPTAPLPQPPPPAHACWGLCCPADRIWESSPQGWKNRNLAPPRVVNQSWVETPFSWLSAPGNRSLPHWKINAGSFEGASAELKTAHRWDRSCHLPTPSSLFGRGCPQNR